MGAPMQETSRGGLSRTVSTEGSLRAARTCLTLATPEETQRMMCMSPTGKEKEWGSHDATERESMLPETSLEKD